MILNVLSGLDSIMLIGFGSAITLGTKSDWKPMRKELYLFIDEGGDMNFSSSGTKYFTLTALSKARPFMASEPLTNLKYDLWEKDIKFEYFHATEDTQITRNEVFNILSKNISRFTIDSVIVEKRKTHPTLQDPSKFYRKTFEILLNYVLSRHQGKDIKIFVVTDTIPIKKNRKEIQKAIKSYIKNWSSTFKILHYASKSDINLQIVDYFNWAIFRKWERKDYRSYRLIEKAIYSENMTALTIPKEKPPGFLSSGRNL